MKMPEHWHTLQSRHLFTHMSHAEVGYHKKYAYEGHALEAELATMKVHPLMNVFITVWHCKHFGLIKVNQNVSKALYPVRILFCLSMDKP